MQSVRQAIVVAIADVIAGRIDDVDAITVQMWA